MKIFRSDHYPMPLPAGHRFPASKYTMLYEQVALFAKWLCVDTPVATVDELVAAHTPDYVQRQLDGLLTLSEQRVIGLPWSPELVPRGVDRGLWREPGRRHTPRLCRPRQRVLRVQRFGGGLA